MTNPASPELAGRVKRALPRIAVDLDRKAASVDGAEVFADDEADLKEALTALVYGAFHSGIPPDRDDINRVYGQAGVEKMMAAAMPHRWSVRDDVEVVRRDDGQKFCVVRLDRLNVKVPREHVDLLAGKRARVKVEAARPRLSPGFFLVEGSGGPPDRTSPVLRCYCHLADVHSGAEAFGAVLKFLERSCPRYRVKIVSSATGYPRHDALVVYVEADQHHMPSGVVSAVADCTGLRPQTSVFAAEVAPGVAIASEPADQRPGYQGLSFGQHRSRLLVEGIFASLTSRQPDAAAVVAEEFLRGNVNPLAPEHNHR
jgi:HopA1 effector protein family